MYLNFHRIFSECFGEFLDLQTQLSTILILDSLFFLYFETARLGQFTCTY